LRIRLGTARPGDILRLAALLGILFRQESDFRPDTRKQRAGLRRIMRDPRVGRIFTAKADGKLVGMVVLLFSVSTAEGGAAAWLEDFVVDPAWRGRGIGTQLIKNAIAYARRRRFKRVTLLTDRSNRRVLSFYRRTGFRVSTMVPLRLPLRDQEPPFPSR